MKKTLIKNGRLIDPSQGIDGAFDLLISGDKIAQVAPQGRTSAADAEIIDAKGMVVSPGFIDMHTHLREPGFEYKETIASGTAAAVSGGFTSVCCMANTDPVNDNASVTDYINRKAHDSGFCRVYPIGAVTKGLKGEELASIAELKTSGCVAISDDGNTLQDGNMMRLALSYAKGFDLPVITHSMDKSLSENGHMNESFMSTKLGIKGIPNAAEDIMIARDIMLAELTGAHVHVAHLSTRQGIRLVKEAKQRGIKVTCEVTPHHFTLTDASLSDYNTNFKMSPPLRSADDVRAIKEALSEKNIFDAIATDHAPHGIIDKEIEFDKAASGIIGLETALPLALALVRDGVLGLDEMIRLFTMGPAGVLGLSGGTLKEGAAADITIFDPDHAWVLDRRRIVSKSKNSPFIDMPLKGRAIKTIVSGKLVFDAMRGQTGVHS
ncbi:MAG: dihydroorotase [Deltaproteobacteria bacterium]|nr:dihydroorotase [Deltaproteobacteria bacterium]